MKRERDAMVANARFFLLKRLEETGSVSYQGFSAGFTYPEAALIIEDEGLADHDSKKCVLTKRAEDSEVVWP